MLSNIKALIRKDKRTKNGKKITLETYKDYPSGVSNNAKRGIELNEKVNNKCATQVGKIRAQQLANKENISLETIKRMYSYLSRSKKNTMMKVIVQLVVLYLIYYGVVKLA